MILINQYEMRFLWAFLFTMCIQMTINKFDGRQCVAADALAIS